jgi:hypothetical protein
MLWSTLVATRAIEAQARAIAQVTILEAKNSQLQRQQSQSSQQARTSSSNESKGEVIMEKKHASSNAAGKVDTPTVGSNHHPIPPASSSMSSAVASLETPSRVPFTPPC